MKRDGIFLAVLLTLFSSLCAVGLVVLFDQIDHLVVFIVVGIMFILVAAPIMFRVARNDLDPFESIVPYGVMNFLYYGAGTLFVLFVKGVAFDSNILPYLDVASVCCVLGFACALVGYYVGGKVIRPRLGAQGPVPGVALMMVVYLVGFSGEVMNSIIEKVPMRFSSLISGVDSLVSNLAFLSHFAIFYALYMMMSGRGTKSFKLMVFMIILPTQLFTQFQRVGNKTALFFLVGLPIIAYWYAHHRIAWKTVIVCALIGIFIIFPAYYTVRNYKSAYYSQSARIEKTIEATTKQQAGELAEGALRTTARRLAIINSTAIIMRECGSRVDYQMGQTLMLGAVSIIPRVFWPDKPIITIGIQFSKTFHITRFGDYTATSPSQVGELYWNFNIVGVIVGMFLIGIWLRALYLRLGANRGTDPFRLAMYVTMLYMTLQMTDASLGGLEALIIKQGAILLGLEKLFLLLESFTKGRVNAPAGVAQARTS